MIRNPNITSALKALAPTAEFGVADNLYSKITWLSTDIPKPTEAEVQAEIARQTADLPLIQCTDTARALLAASDWSVLPDVNISNKAEFETYRATLRTLMFNPVQFPDFPTEPQPIWI